MIVPHLLTLPRPLVPVPELSTGVATFPPISSPIWAIHCSLAATYLPETAPGGLEGTICWTILHHTDRRLAEAAVHKRVDVVRVT